MYQNLKYEFKKNSAPLWWGKWDVSQSFIFSDDVWALLILTIVTSPCQPKDITYLKEEFLSKHIHSEFITYFLVFDVHLWLTLLINSKPANYTHFSKFPGLEIKPSIYLNFYFCRFYFPFFFQNKIWVFKCHLLQPSR